MKSKKTITLIIASILLVAVIVTASIFAFISKTYVVTDIAKPDYMFIHNGQYSTLIYEDGQSNNVYNEIMNLYNKMFEDTFYSALLDGRKNIETIVESRTKSNLDNYIESSDSVFIEFRYSEGQTLTLNGETYVDTDITPNITNIMYKGIIIEINSKEEFSEFTMYVLNYETYNEEEVEEIVQFNSNYRITALAKQSDMFNYISEI